MIGDDEVRRLGEAHYSFLSAWPGYVREDVHGSSLIGNALIPVPFRNHATFVRTTEREVGALVEAVTRFYTDLGAIPAFQLEPGTQPPDLGDLLTRHAFRKQVEEAWMVWEPGESSAENPPASLTIETVDEKSSPAAVQAYIDSYNVSFRTPPHACAGFGASFRGVLAGRDAIHYVGRIGGEYAGAMSLFARAGYGGVYNVGTFPAFRGRGVASALLKRLIGDAAQRNAHTLFLQAVHGGPAQPIYARAGFRTRFVREWYLPDAPGGIWSA